MGHNRLLSETELTNFRRLIKRGCGIPVRWLGAQGGPHGAFDEMPDELKAAKPNVASFLKRLAAAMSPEDWARLQKELCGEQSEIAGDEPPPFPGRPRVGGGRDPLAADSKLAKASFAEMYGEHAASLAHKGTRRPLTGPSFRG